MLFLCASHCAKNSHYIISFNPPKKPVRQGILVFFLYKWEKWGQKGAVAPVHLENNLAFLECRNPHLHSQGYVVLLSRGSWHPKSGGQIHCGLQKLCQRYTPRVQSVLLMMEWQQGSHFPLLQKFQYWSLLSLQKSRFPRRASLTPRNISRSLSFLLGSEDRRAFPTFSENW